MVLGSLIHVGLAPFLLAFFARSIVVVVIGVVGSAGAVQSPLQPADGLVLVLKLAAEAFQCGIGRGHYRDRGGTDIQSDHTSTYGVPGFPVRLSFTDQLGIETVASIQLATHQAHELDRAGQSMCDNLVVWVNVGRQLQPRPPDPFLPPPDAAGVGLAFHRVEPTLALETRFPLLANGELLHGQESSRGCLLDRQAVQMFAQPGMPELLGVDMQVVFPKACLLIGGMKSGIPCPGSR